MVSPASVAESGSHPAICALDHVASGKNAQASTLLGFKLYSREHFAVLLLSSMAGVHALRIDPDGSVKPFELSGAD